MVPAMSSTDPIRSQPWYRQFWPWFLIALPALAVCGGIATIVVATSNPHSMVVDDYARIGLATHRKLARDRRAADLGMVAQISLADDTVQVRLDGAGARPAELVMLLSHPTLPDADRQLLLEGKGETYTGSLERPLEGRWYVQLTPPDGDWRLAGELGDGESTISLSPSSDAR